MQITAQGSLDTGQNSQCVSVKIFDSSCSQLFLRSQYPFEKARGTWKQLIALWILRPSTRFSCLYTLNITKKHKLAIWKKTLHGITESTSVIYLHTTKQPPLLLLSPPFPPHFFFFFFMVRQFIQVRTENSRSSPHTYVLGLNSLEDYVVQAFLLFIQNGTSKRCYKKKLDRMLEGVGEGWSFS